MSDCNTDASMIESSFGVKYRRLYDRIVIRRRMETEGNKPPKKLDPATAAELMREATETIRVLCDEDIFPGCSGCPFHELGNKRPGIHGCADYFYRLPVIWESIGGDNDA